MAQLFDGHPDVLAHPHELKIGYPNKRIWPPTDIADLDEQFRVLFELNNIEFFESGYTKGRHNSYRMNFFLMPQLQRELFREAPAKSGRTGARTCSMHTSLHTLTRGSICARGSIGPGSCPGSCR